MSALTESQYKELVNMGKDFEFDKSDPSLFKADSSLELRAFIEGYKAAREMDSFPVDESTYLKQIGELVDRVIELEEKEASLEENNKGMTM